MMHFNVHDTLIGSALGVPFGFALNKSQCHKPRVIREQFELKDFTLFKTFGTSVATGLVGMAATNALGYTTIMIKPTYTWANIVGGLMVGAGTYIGATSMEAGLAQGGSGKKRAILSIAGSLSGALTFGLVEPWIRTTFLSDRGSLCALHRYFDLPFAAVAIPLAGLVAGVLYLVEQTYPMKNIITETTKPPENAVEMTKTILQSESWTPYASGILIGLLQIPTSIYATSMFGVGSAYFSIAASIASLFGAGSTYLSMYRSPDSYWTIPMDIGISAGSAVATATKKKKKEIIKTKPDLTMTQQGLAFLGGFIMAFGSGIALGTPSVHGLSGVTQLSCGSMLALASMFGGGVITAQLLSSVRESI